MTTIQPANQAPGAARCNFSPFSFSWFNRVEVRGAAHRENETLQLVYQDLLRIQSLLENDLQNEAEEIVNSVVAKLQPLVGA